MAGMVVVVVVGGMVVVVGGEVPTTTLSISCSIFNTMSSLLINDDNLHQISIKSPSNQINNQIKSINK